ncbi:L,D-transpeptidase family protein [Azospirillum oleiclasticum]|uniref:L,D-transpeptidase family protein n=3 Tax=Azospirillum oleiclasticum TaxID=2735135 RepID=A0ABX2TAI1_9PROT|nr:L,D-transpeptidase family protein [Azospirillum oleiclasticum]NYZ21196.1 L,D-transpeptidase family protein [Azospirillum oleiclasticum]
MLTTSATTSRSLAVLTLAALAITGLSAAACAQAPTTPLAPLSVAPALAEPATPAPVPAYPAMLSAWADRLDARAAELEAMAPVAITRVGPGGTLKKGASGERTSRLIQRLIELGYLTPEQRSASFDDLVDTAVRSFQTASNMTPDGLVGTGTQQALDRSPAEAAGIMRHTATSMRALRDEQLPDAVLVNLPSQTVTLVRDSARVFDMRAVVGRPSRETPLLRDRITHVIVNPTWTVPPTVLKEDKLPMLRSRGTPGISNAVVYLDGEVVAPEIIDWSVVTPGRVRIVQQPGDHNALGRFRFNLTNPENIYLHGTNEPRLFDRELRTISSGCVRLQDARLMAETLLAPQGVTPDRIERMLARGEPQWVKLEKALPVRFTYWMATIDGSGTIRLHPDVYDRVEEAPPSSALPPGDSSRA